MSVARTDSGGGGGELHTVTVIKDDKGYGMTVSGNDPVVVQSVVKLGAAWRAGVRTGDRLLVVNGTSVETSVHTHVVQLIRSSPTVVLKLQRHSTVTAPLPVGREKQRQVEFTKVQTIQLMLESENQYIEKLRSSLARSGSDRKQADLEAAELRRAKLQHQAELLMQNVGLSLRESPSSPPPLGLFPPGDVPSQQQRQGFLSHLPRSLSSLTGQSLRSIRNSNQAQASPVTCLDSGSGGGSVAPPLPPRSTAPPTPPPPPPPPSSHHHQHRHHHTAPNSIAVQMAYPLVAVTPPLIQNAVPGHHRSKSSPEELNELNNSNEDKDWEMVSTPPGTPPPPYPSSPVPQITLDSQRAIISMEEDDTSPTLSRSMYSSGGFTSVDSLSVSRLCVFLNWVVGERRPSQAALLYLLSAAYCHGQAQALPRWAYELHSAFLVPQAPLALSSVDENMAREIDDALINEHEKEEVLRKIFLKVREKAKEEMTQQLNEFQIKRQLGLGTFYGPPDSVLDQCEVDKAQELDVISKWLVPRLKVWMDASSADHWGATYGSSVAALLAAAVPPLLQHTFGLKPQMISSLLPPTPPGSPPRPAFLQRDKPFKQRMKHINKSTNHPLVIRNHHLCPMTVTSLCDCHHCHTLIWGIAPQAYNCSDCKLRVHRSCARQVEETCCGPAAPPTRISRLMEKLTPATQVLPQPTGNSHQHPESNQHHHYHHHHQHHEKRPKKSLASTHFLNMERSTKKTEDDSMSGLDTSTTSHNTSGDSRRDDDAGADSVSQMTDSSHFSSEHSAERSDSNAQSRNGSGIAARPVTRAESYRDRADRVKRTKRKTSDPNQLTSNKDFPDMEVLGAAGGPAVPSGGSSNSSLSSKSNDSMQPDNEGSQSEWSEEEDCGGPWSARAAPELIASMSGIARKRQDLIHELIWSECSHVRWLRVLRRVYLSPLRRAGASLLPPAELHSLLPNLPDVLSRHKRLAAELRALQNGTIATAVPTRPVAEALVSMLGESKYSCALARFCGGQGLALDALRERRKRNKDLNAFLLKSEQDPLCVRLRLQDLLACVWQRLTKYQLLLEGIMKTATAEELSGSGNNNSGAEGGADSGDDFSRVAYALDLAKDVLNTVNTAIKTTENEHRLKSIQSKLEVRVSEAVEVGELRKFDLSRHSLVMEGTLSIRQDSNKRVNILALLLRECMVLLHTDGDRYILKAIPQATHQPLSPIIHWSMMLFRNNAAVKNGFFLVNINGLQMYEFSAASSAEYNTWAKHLSEAATALEAKHGATEEGPPPPIPSNTSSAATTPENIPNGTPDAEVDAAAATSNHQGPDTKQPDNEDDGNQVNGAEVSVVSEEEAGISGPNLGGDSKMDSSLLDPALLTVTQPPLTMVATVEITPQERLRRAEEKVKSALLEAAEASRELWGPRPLLRAPLDHLVGTQDAQLDTEDTAQQLISQAQEHMNTLTMVVLRALRVSPASCLGSKCPSHSGEGLCDQCADLPDRNSNGNTAIKDDGEETMDSIVLEKVGESSTDPTNECEVSLAGVRDCGRGLRGTLAQLEVRLAAMEAEREMLRAQLQRADHRIHHMHQLHKDCIHIETPVKLEINEGNSINNSSNDHSSGPG